MSWEGFEQHWCRSGHYTTDKGYGLPWEDDGSLKCPKCGMPIVFSHVVNQANCSGVYIEPIHLYGEIYEIPTEEDREKAREEHYKVCKDC